jgi:hypothetical protein
MSRKTPSVPGYVERLVEDEYVQEQLRTAAERLLSAYRRASRQGPRATEDQKVYDKVREAVVSIRRAVGALEEPPPKPKRRWPSLLLLAAAAAVAAFAFFARPRGGGEAHAPAASAAANGAGAPAPGEPVA